MALTDKELYLRIGRPQNACMKCGATIAIAGKHASALLDPDGPDTAPREDTQLRRDYCSECWQNMGEGHYVGYWMARREAPKPRQIRTRKERNAALLSYFEMLRSRQSLEGEDCTQSLFFLAHLLMKYSVFKWARSTPANAEGGERIYFRNTTNDDVVEILSVELQDARLAEIKREVDEYLASAVSGEENASLQEQPLTPA
ncbi:MAG: hypothetical protein ACR2IE_11330 [Candidatus Sumerlaeaceae bacterium]